MTVSIFRPRTLLEAKELPALRWVAYAIADVGRVKLEAARFHVEAWAALRSQGVPPKFLRELLEESLPDVEPMTHMRAWVGSTAPLVLVGDVGTAKSYALAWWALERHKAGELTHWASVAQWGSLEWADLRALTRSLIEKPALCLDDIGAGDLSPGAAKVLESVLLGRHQEERPTALAMNANQKQFKDTIGRRMIDRITNEGGAVRVIRSTKSLRRKPPEGLDSKGRSNNWHRSKWALEAVGCVVVSRGGDVYETAWLPDKHGVLCESQKLVSHGDYSETATYGDALAAVVDRDGVELLERARAHLGIDVEAVLAKGFELEEASATDPITLMAEKFMGTIRTQALAEERARTIQVAPPACRPSLAPDPARHASAIVIPLGFDTKHVDVAQLKLWGMWVRRDQDRGVELRIGKKPLTETSKHEGRLLAYGFESEDEAWRHAARLYPKPGGTAPLMLEVSP